MATYPKELNDALIQDFGKAIAAGIVPTVTPWLKLGYNPSISTPEEGIWSAGDVQNIPAAAAKVEVVSTDNTNDKAAGTGARTVTLIYLDANYVEKTETLTMNGTSAVETTAADIIRINGIRVTTAGSTGAATGTISVRHLTDTPIYTQIAIGETRARNLLYTVPAGKTLYIDQMLVSSGNTTLDKGHLTFRLKAKYCDITKAVSTVWITWAEGYAAASSSVQDFCVPLCFPEKTDIKVTAVGASSTANAIAVCSLRGYLVG